MIRSIIGTKQKQGRLFTEKGESIPVTYISTRDVKVIGLKTQAKDGYVAVQLGIGTRRPSTISRAVLGHAKKAGLATPPRHLKEVRVAGEDLTDAVVPGAAVVVSEVLQAGDTVAVTGVSKGKGFAGVVKRHGFRGGPKTHGQSDRERAPGSIGQTTTPGRVYKGKRMAGRMGQDTVTVKNLTVVSVDDTSSTVVVKGVVPGGRNGLLVIQKI